MTRFIAIVLTIGMVDQNVHNNFILDFSKTLGSPQLNLLLFLMKLPYFFFDIALAFVLMALFKSESEKKWAFVLWMFNPVNLYATYMVGQFDIIPTFLTVAALYLALKKTSLL